jgi:N-acetylneuraminate synthase
MQWRNDPTTLSMIFHREPKVWETFWPEFQRTYFLNRPEINPVFAVLQGKRVGFVRFDPIPHPHGLSGSTVNTSINISPDSRGKGLGRRVLRAMLSHLKSRGIDSVHAEILAHNKASIRAFEAAGFRSIGSKEKLISDTRETHQVECFLVDMTSVFWRKRKVYVIAEAGSNWRMGSQKRDMAMARALIDVAVEAGADAVKFQTYKAESVYVANAGQSGYLSEAGIQEEIQDIFSDLSMPHEMIPELANYCQRAGIDFMSTPFSPVDFLAIDPFVNVHKIASYEISHIHLLRLAARSGKPLVLSTGASNEDDIDWAVETFIGEGGKDLCLLQCTAKYPAPVSSLNVKAIPWLRTRFGVAAGLSDHSREPALGPIMAVAVGARVIEKHYTLDNRLPGPDHSFAITPTELTALVRQVRMAEEALGDGAKQVQAVERELAAYARRGLQATRKIDVGDVLAEGRNFDVLRPGQQSLGAHPKFISEIEGRKAGRPYTLGEGLKVDDTKQ